MNIQNERNKLFIGDVVFCLRGRRFEYWLGKLYDNTVFSHKTDSDLRNKYLRDALRSLSSRYLLGWSRIVSTFQATLMLVALLETAIVLLGILTSAT
jgi:hypothetical protein